MSYPAQAAPRRPAAVVSAAVVLLLMALGAVAYAVANLAVVGGTVDRFRTSAEATGAGAGEIDGIVSLLRGSAVLSAVVGVVMGLLLVGLALGLLAGRPGARVGTWLVCGLGLLFGCCGLAVLVGQRAAPLRLGADERVTADLLARLGDAYPRWWIPVNAAVSVAQVLGYLLVAALLILPAARAFYHRRTVPLVPATPMPPGPGAAPGYGPPPGPPPLGYGMPASAPPAPGPPSPWGPPPGPTPPPVSGLPGPASPPASTPPGPTPPPEDRP